MTRKLVYAGFGCMGGMLAAALCGRYTAAVTVILLAAGAVISIVRRDAVRYVMTVCISAAVGALAYSAANVPPVMGETSFEGVVTEADTDGVPFYTVKHGRQLTGIYLYGEYSLIRGDRVSVKGELCEPENPDFMRSKGILSVMYSPEVTVKEKDRQPYKFIDDLRQSSISEIRSLEMGDAGEYLIGMLFGSRYWEISSPALSSLYGAGAGHTAAVSGLHLSIAAMIAAAVTGRSKKLRFFAAAAAGAVIVLCADMTVPVIRAYIMTLIVYGAGLVRRRGDALNSLAAAVLLILLHSPLCVTGASFILSLSGTFGAAVLSPWAEKELTEIKARKDGTEPLFTHIHPVMRTAVFILCTQTAILPASFVFFDGISGISPVTNLAVIPLCTPALFFSYLGVFAGGAAGKLFFIFAGVTAKVILALCGLLSGLAFPLPAGAILPGMIFGAAAACLAGLAGGKKTALPVMLSSAALVMMAGTAVYLSGLHTPQTHMADGYALIKTETGSAAVDTGDNRYELKKAAARYGLHPTAVFCTQGQSSKYAADFPDAKVYIIEGEQLYTVDGIPLYINGSRIRVGSKNG
ncbi:MAG: ComEC/Rec2 family competence protein [Oscillospiraceae bacterium]|nr:ComEC/Rec2 family competence protein [Oscillospiraceae bacterium]